MGSLGQIFRQSSSLLGGGTVTQWVASTINARPLISSGKMRCSEIKHLESFWGCPTSSVGGWDARWVLCIILVMVYWRWYKNSPGALGTHQHARAPLGSTHYRWYYQCGRPTWGLELGWSRRDSGWAHWAPSFRWVQSEIPKVTFLATVAVDACMGHRKCDGRRTSEPGVRLCCSRCWPPVCIDVNWGEHWR